MSVALAPPAAIVSALLAELDRLACTLCAAPPRMVRRRDFVWHLRRVHGFHRLEALAFCNTAVRAAYLPEARAMMTCPFCGLPGHTRASACPVLLPRLRELLLELDAEVLRVERLLTRARGRRERILEIIRSLMAP